MRVRVPDSIDLGVHQNRVEKELLKFLAAQGAPIEPRRVYGPLAEKCGLSKAQQNVPRRDRNESAWNNLVQQARRRLVIEGQMTGQPPRNLWSLTAKGLDTANRLNRGITVDDLWAPS